MAKGDVVVTDEELRRVTAMQLAINLNNFRNDISRDTEKVITDAKRIGEYLENGT
jgi:hypothetical protein